jgi:primase-polymerase (primpol)-like protein
MRDGKLTKIPIRADSGLNAESDDLTTWTTFDKVREAFEKGRGGALGVGFVFARSSELSGVDLDHCRDTSTGEIDEWAKTYLNRLNSYTEISPSGAGLHVLIKGSIPVTGADGGRQKKLKGDGYRSNAAIEMYSAKRFFTMTGNVLPDHPQSVESRQDELMGIYEEVFGKAEPVQTKTQEKAHDGPSRQDAEAALAAEVEALRACPISDRREQLKKSASSLGKFVSDGTLKVGEVTTALGRATERSGLETDEIYSIILDSMSASRPPVEEVGPSDKKKRTSALSDEAVIARMLGGTNADEIERLLKGDTSAYAGDDSGADQALCNHLAFWTAKNRQQMDSIFRTSKLMRPKWDEKRGAQTYGETTIDKAIRDTKEVYQPDEESSSTHPVDEIVLPAGLRLWADNLTPGVPGVDKNGITYHRAEKTNKKGETVYVKTKICDGYCCITEETRDEIGEASFTVEGRGSKDGHVFKFDITGRDFSDKRKLKAALVAHFGARNRVKDLTGDIIQSLTLDVKKLTLITSPRWIDDRLAVPGLDGTGFKFNLSRRVPADLSTGEDERGLAALKLILDTWPAENSAILIAADLASPVCGRWFPGDRFGLALVGTTGRGLKTEALKHVMAVYGAGFLSEESLLRWGEGATNNAMLAIASACGCLPTGIDNYKATHRDGASKFVSVVHTILEGRERERLNRNAELRETREYASTLLVTGEDLPEEASTVARLLPVEWSTPPNFDKLTELQAIANHLPAVGRLWCEYLSSIAELPMDAWKASRSELVSVAKEAGAINPGRIGTTVAILKQVWMMALSSPLGEVLKDYSSDLENGLVSLIKSTAEAAEDATEASQFVDTLKELISSGRCIVLNHIYTGEEITRPNVIGWRLKEDGKDTGEVAILPKLAMDAVRRVTGPQAMGQEIGPKSLYRQLREAGLIADGSGKGQRLAIKRAGSKTVRVLVFKPDTLMGDGVLDEVDLSKAAAYAGEDIEIRKKADDLNTRLKKAVSVK